MKNRFRLTPIAFGGWKFILGFIAIGLWFLFLDIWLQKTLGVLALLLALFCLKFFQDPDREIPKTSDVLSPADGTIWEISDVNGEGYGRGRVVRIFLSVFDVHVQRSPVVGKVLDTRYSPGLFLDARHPRAPFANEANAIEIETARGRVMVKQIAGFIARRILCWVRASDQLELGERIGLIRFGSQVDLYVPLDVEILVKEGDKVVGGLTSIGRWREAAVSSVRAPSESVTAPLSGAGV